VLAGGDRGHHRVLGLAVAADQLADDVDVGAGDRAGDVVGEQRRIDLDQALLLAGGAHGDRAHHQPTAEARADRGGVVLEQLDHAGADVAEPEQGHADLAHRGGHGPARYE
jgi:hypothetical protein